MEILGKEPYKAYIDSQTGNSPELMHSKSKSPVECYEWLKAQINIGERFDFAYKPKYSASHHIIKVFKSDYEETSNLKNVRFKF